MARIFIRDSERLTCEIRPAPAGAGFDLVWTQDGEDHVEHYPAKGEAEARSLRVAADLIHDGWSLVQ